jgi:hypothetical protein
MAKSRKVKTEKSKVKRRRTSNKASIVAKRAASAVNILTGAMRNTQFNDLPFDGSKNVQ